MTDQSKNEDDPDKTIARPTVKSDPPVRKVAPPSGTPKIATPQPAVRPADQSAGERASSESSAPTPQRGGAQPAEPVRKEAKAKARAAAAASGPAGAGASSSGGAGGTSPSGSAAMSTPPAARASGTATPGTGTKVGLNAGNAPGAPTSPAAGPATEVKSKSASEVLDPQADETQVIAATPATGAASSTGAVEATVERVKRRVRNPDNHRTRKARLRLAKVDPWSVMKTTFLFAIAFMIAGLAAVMLLYSVISSSGVFDSINEIVGQVLSAPGDTTPFLIQDYLTAQRVAGFTIVIGVLNVVLLTAIGTLAAFLYNLASSLLGGLEVTLAED